MSINQIVKPYTFANGAGNYADAEQVNENFDTVVSKVNELVAALNLAAGSKPSLDDRLDMALAADGTPLVGATAGGAWLVLPTHEATYVDAYTFTVKGDHTDIYLAYRRAKITVAAGDVFAEVASASYSGVSGLTTVYLLEEVLTDPISEVAVSSYIPDTATGTNMSPRGLTPVTISTVASETAQGIVELATSAETITGEDVGRAVTPAGAKAAIDAAITARVASDTAAGIVELATGAETIAGEDTGRAVTPAANKAALDARVTGVTASTAEALAGESAAKFLTPASVAENISPASGYAKLPGGLILQWGETTGSEDTWASRNFNVEFPNAALCVVVSGNEGYTSTDTEIQARVTTSKTQFQVYNNNYGSRKINWIAIGH